MAKKKAQKKSNKRAGSTKRLKSSQGSPVVKTSALRRLLQNEADSLFRALLLFPCPLGAWMAGASRPIPFLIVFTGVYLGLLLGVASNPRDSGKKALSSNTTIAGYFLILALFVVSYWHSSQWTFSLATVAGSILSFYSIVISSRDGKWFPASLLLVLLHMSWASVLGVLSQSGEILPHPALFGSVMALPLIASRIALRSTQFEAEGWKRQITVKTRKGEMVDRPGSLSRAYVLSLILGPALPIMLCPLGLVPFEFMLLGFALLPTVNLAKGFQEGLHHSKQSELGALRVSLLAAFLFFLVGLVL